jgi:hypothetical protein
MILFIKFITAYLKYGIALSLVIFFIFRNNFILLIISLILIIVSFFLFQYFFWVKSYFIITNEKLVIKVRNWLFSKYHMNLFFKNIKDMAYSKNNLFHYMFDYGTFFARSSAGSDGDFEALYIPTVEKVYKIVNFLYLLDEKERRAIRDLDEIKNGKKEISQKKWENIIKEEKENLLKIKGVKEAVVLNDNDRKFIFEQEEDKNHGVYECLKRKALFCITHDSNLRNPDAPIVLKLGKKVIFPAVSFHEIKRPSVVSSSPWLEVHNYLIQKFKNADQYDATILIGFDLE